MRMALPRDLVLSMVLGAAAVAAGCIGEGGGRPAGRPGAGGAGGGTGGTGGGGNSTNPPTTPDAGASPEMDAPLPAEAAKLDGGGSPSPDGPAPADSGALRDLSGGDGPPDTLARDGGVPGQEAGVPGVRLSLADDLASRWVGARRSITMEGGTRVFTGGFVAGQIGGPNGHTFRLPISPGREYLFEYRIRFEPGFHFSRGGKIPGLAGASAPTGCVNVTGNGFSARAMWHENGRLTGYTYDNDQSTGCGNSIQTSFNFGIGTWYSVKQRVKLNTGTARNGVMQMWVDDRMVIDKGNIPWMNEAPDRRIDVVLFHTFFGGSTQNWAPSRNCSVSFSDPFVTKLAD